MDDLPCGLIIWWSIFHQRWNWTEWIGFDKTGKGNNRVYNGKPILSDAQLLKRIDRESKRLFPSVNGKSEVVESGYAAVWSTSGDHRKFLANVIWDIVCTAL